MPRARRTRRAATSVIDAVMQAWRLSSRTRVRVENRPQYQARPAQAVIERAQVRKENNHVDRA
jgi:hypothetical protein